VSSDKNIIWNAVRSALEAMRDSGFEISDKVEVVLDPKLPFMGYSTKRNGKNVIVISGMAIKSGPIEGLLIHEMCHIYRTDQNHPSHNSELLNTVGHTVIHKNQLTKDYQIKTIQQAVNHIQDLYADDITFKVFQKSGSFTHEQAFEFFLDWINDTMSTPKTKKDKWLNIGVMLNNSFAISNLTRHKIVDIDNQAENKIQKFLSQINPSMKKEFTYFRNFMTNLKENPAETQFKKDLTEYLTRTIKLAECSL
jgi:hypothetical protein